VPLLLGTTAAVTAATGAAAMVPPAVASGSCGTTATPPTYKHVIWVWMENHSYGTIIGSAQAPYINSLAAECGLATNYHNVSQPRVHRRHDGRVHHLGRGRERQLRRR
jgi:phosphatidylinositol-3-phosphatase